MSRRSRNSICAAFLAFACVLPACRKSKTAKQIKKFADKVCACQDAACAEAVQAEYLEWWKGNTRARGSESDRKGVEKAMQRYAECHGALVGPETPKPAASKVKPAVPDVNLAPRESADAPPSTTGESDAVPALAPTPEPSDDPADSL